MAVFENTRIVRAPLLDTTLGYHAAIQIVLK